MLNWCCMMTSLVRGDLLSGNLDPPKSSTHQNVVVLRNPQTLSFEDLRILGSEDFHHVLDVCQPPSTPPLMDTLLADTPFKSNIQVLQADIVYDKELRISSLKEGLQYFDNFNYYLRNIPAAKLKWLTWFPTAMSTPRSIVEFPSLSRISYYWP